MFARWVALSLWAACAPSVNHEGEPEVSLGSAPRLDGVPEVRRTFDMAFLLLVNPDQALDSASTAANVAKLEELTGELEAQFLRSTYGTGQLRVDPMIHVYQTRFDLNNAGFVGNVQELLGLREIIVDRFYADQPDVYDFLAVFSHAPSDAVRFGHQHREMRPLMMGLGREPEEARHELWGSAGRLRGIGFVLDANRLPDAYDFRESKMRLLLHETVGHSFGMFMPELALHPGSGHFFAGVEGPHQTIMYARPWEQDPEDPRAFTRRDEIDEATGYPFEVFHPWVLYHVGLLERSEVPDHVLCIDYEGRLADEITGLPIAIHLDDIIATHGDRVLIE